jgi:chromatin segregation and condensation protein Rec8/ScpA/Scc1 (kleisin family)
MSRGSRAERAVTDWRLLLNPAELRRFRPWSVKLIPLIRQLAEVVRGLSITLSQAGVAIYTAAVIHREKSERIDEQEQTRRFERPDLLVPPPINVDIKLDDYLVKIEEEFGEFLEELMALLSSSPEFPLEELIRGLSRLEAVKRIILLLFAASRGYVDVLQDELTGKVIVRAVNAVAA